MQNRRDFIKQSGAACAALAGLGFLTTLEGCAPAKNITASTYDAASNKISFPLTSLDSQGKAVVNGPNSEYSIFVRKKSESELEALQLKCTHRGHSVNVEEAKLHCPLHGSEFDLDGNVIHGPAKEPLKRFPVTVEGGNAVIVVA
jgi:Rieske Fe-S protein